MSTTTAVTSSTEALLGRVKWFNNRDGYGFITVTDGPRSGSDIFVHHSSIKVVSEQYKYLVQGEYVEFVLVATPGSKHEFQASDVSGVKGGKLMCETRNESRQARSQFRRSEPSQQHEDMRFQRQGRGSGRGRGRGRGQGSGRGRGRDSTV
jgi:cold shock CspA family protein